MATAHDGDRGVPTVRILLVEDHKRFREFVRSKLGERPGLQVIGKASDGLEGVRKAQELRPDLILLNIGLPSLNGIEAARRIRKLTPKSRIVFLTQESSADIVQVALSVGSLGYIIKLHAGSELLAAVEAVVQGKKFISAALAGQVLIDRADEQTRGVGRILGMPLPEAEE